jgi:hypothetical protein
VTPALNRLCAGIATVVFLVAVIWGFAIVGSPAAQRDRRFDEQRISDLSDIHEAILRHVREVGPARGADAAGAERRLKRPLPESLEMVVEVAIDLRPNTTDPETGRPYEYTVTGESTYELCAEFVTERDRRDRPFWNHPAGRHCFSFDALDDGSGPTPMPPWLMRD